MQHNAFPFFHSIGQQLQQSIHDNRVSHAQLFVGQEGNGVYQMALQFAQNLILHSLQDHPELVEKSKSHFEANNHPDIHFCYPHWKSKTENKTLYTHFRADWIEYLEHQPYPTYKSWVHYIGEKKSNQIYVDDANHILQKLGMKSTYGGAQVQIIWNAHKLNTDAANKLLKLIEEPENNTYFILITHQLEKIISTISSRCQLVYFLPHSNEELTEYLEKTHQKSASEIKGILQKSGKNLNKIEQILANDNEDIVQMEELFLQLCRAAFKANRNVRVLNDLFAWSELVAKWSLDKQVEFLKYCLEIIRQGFLQHIEVDEISYYEPQVESFRFQDFAKYIHTENLMDFYNEIDLAIYHLQRNANAKIILLDLSFKISRFFHKKLSVDTV